MTSDPSKAIKTPERTDMKVVFAYPSWTGEYGLFGHFAKRNSTWPPLNLALLAAITEQAGHEAVIIDGEAERLKKEKLAKKVVESKPDLVGLTCYSPFFHLSAESPLCYMSRQYPDDHRRNVSWNPPSFRTGFRRSRRNTNIFSRRP